VAARTGNLDRVTRPEPATSSRERFPRSSAYDPEWVVSGASGGAHALWLCEWLTEVLELRPGMRVLDLGCGRGTSSIFLSREFGVQVWATDLWFDATERSCRIRDAGVADRVFPVHADARALPFAAEFFDVVVGVDSFVYFGTDDLYANYLARFVAPGGAVGIVGAGLVDEFDGPVPEHLRGWWEPSMACLHSAAWWRRHWQRSGVLDVERADTMPEGWRWWLEWQRTASQDNHTEIDAVVADHGRHLGYFRVLARRRTDAQPDEPIISLPTEYVRRPLLAPEEPA
jgi:SAM-dependent methyltransferase